MSILILGAEGFIGRALRRRLAPRHRLISVDKVELSTLDDFQVTGEETRIVADLGVSEDIDGIFSELGDEVESITAIVHLAAYYDFSNRDDSRYHALESGLPHLLDALDARVPIGAPLLYASSMSTLPTTPPGVPMGPDTESRAQWAYPKHKVTCEQILDASDSRRTRAQLVLAGVYSDFGELVPLYQQIKRISERSVEALFYPGRVDRGLTYVHVDDVAVAFERAIDSYSGTVGETHRLMVAEEKPVTYQEIHDRTARALHGHPMPLIRVPKLLAWLGALMLFGLARLFGQRRFVRPWMVRYAGEHYEIDSSRTREELGWAPEHSLQRDLGAILARARQTPEEFHALNERRPW